MRDLGFFLCIVALVVAYGAYSYACGFERGGRLAWTRALNEVSAAVPITTSMLPRAQAWSDSTYKAHYGGFWQSVAGRER